MQIKSIFLISPNFLSFFLLRWSRRDFLAPHHTPAPPPSPLSPPTSSVFAIVKEEEDDENDEAELNKQTKIVKTQKESVQIKDKTESVETYPISILIKSADEKRKLERKEQKNKPIFDGGKGGREIRA